MSIYVGDKKALLLKSDNSVVEFYKGDKKLFGYDGKAVGAPLSIGDVHPAEHNVGVKVASKSLVDFPITSATRNKWDNGGVYFGLRVVDISHLRGKTITYQAFIDLTNIDENNLPNYTYLYGCTMLWFYNPDGTTVISAHGGNNIDYSQKSGISKITITVPDVDGVKAFFSARSSFYGAGSTEALGDDYIEFSNPMVELGTTASAYTPYVADLTGVEVARYGGNLIDCNSIVSHNNDVSADFVAGDNSFTMRGNEGTDNLSYNTGMLMFPYGNVPNITSYGIPVKQGITYTVSFDYLLLEQGKWDNRIEAIIYTDTLGIENNKSFGGTLGKTERYSITFTASKDEKVGLSFRVNNNYVNISNIILAVGEQTKYEPYKEPIIYTANADGTVEGVKSISPNMTLIPNTNAVTVECEYCKA